MKIIDKKYIKNNEEKIIREIKAGKIFIYPTDTIYGIGANAKKSTSVAKIRTIKERELKPFSVIAPNKKWIKDNFVFNKKIEEWTKKLPGPLTLFLDRKNTACVSEEVNPADDSLGVRIPKHWFTKIIQKAGVPFITTSVNKSGQSYMRRMEDVDSGTLNSVDYIVYEGEKANKESKKVDLRKI
ncbi:MAG TPA: Sua5/YciO/YrdC/YwlC family protein [Candidatus Paceibacterota bacterium]|nr:Sua5/YciO/YrdC/YwlC family protein [Candidatus Paceibacterota bacterium]